MYLIVFSQKCHNVFSQDVLRSTVMTSRAHILCPNLCVMVQPDLMSASTNTYMLPPWVNKYVDIICSNTRDKES